MHALIRIFILLLTVPLGITLLSCSSEKTAALGIELIYLTWSHEDTSHTMSINYITKKSTKTTKIYYDTVSRNGNLSEYRHMLYGKLRTYPGIDFAVHTTSLANLNTDETYYFVVGTKATGYSSERKFRTVPETGNIRFVSGGDTSASETFEEVCRLAAGSNPHFAIIGGDIAYANGEVSAQQSWLDFLDIWQRTMKTRDGYTIPMIAVIGNHDVNSLSQSPFARAPFYYMIFNPADDKTFFKRQIGKKNILYLLDTDHIYSSGGEQLEWMNKHFAEHKNDTFRFASYHVPLYPSFRDPDEPASTLLRKNWLDVFDQYQLDVAFENHEHTLKKSKLLKGHEIVDSQGTIYIGDGNWGMVSRQPVDRWFIESTRPVNHVWVVTLNDHTASFKALTIDGIDDDYTFEIKSSSGLIDNQGQ